MRTYLLILLFAVGLARCSPKIVQPPAPGMSAYPHTEYTLNPRIPLQANVYSAPKLAHLESGDWLTYELHLSNYYTAPLVIDGVEVLSDTVSKTVFYEAMGDSLAPLLRNFTGPDSLKTTLKPGSVAIVFLWIRVATGGQAPPRISHRVLVQLQGKKMALLTAPTEVTETLPVVLAPPLKGIWLVGQGVDPHVKSTEGHNRLLYPQMGAIRMPQRFATDWVKLGNDRKVFVGDSSKNESYYGWGEEVYAVADGVIAEIQNDIPENIPPTMTVPRTQKNITGNYVVLRMNNGKSVFYGHLQTGSIGVAPGDRVKMGQVLARVGNTGNSTGAHLHFQVVDGDHFYDEGYPYAFDSFVRYGTASKREIDAMADGGGAYPRQFLDVRVRNKLPVFGDVVGF
jgi:hypothetical protein